MLRIGDTPPPPPSSIPSFPQSPHSNALVWKGDEPRQLSLRVMVHPLAFARLGQGPAFGRRERSFDRPGICPGGHAVPLFPRARRAGRGAWVRPPTQRAPAAPQPVVSLPTDSVTSWSWSGEDQFTPLGDRQDLPPLPLPAIRRSLRLVVIRHGQSTWNARNRMQGSSNFSVLTDQGHKQAFATGRLLRALEFDLVFHSPLVRAVQTVDAVWKGREGPKVELPHLREVDLYSFQGLEKVEAKFTWGDRYRAWQSDPTNFEVDGHFPVRELWYRASLAWQAVLGAEQLQQRGLIVAHNAVNQALICTALGLPPSCFRRFTQTNAGFNVLDFEARGDGPPEVVVERLNQLPELRLQPEKAGRPALHRLILVCGPANSSRVKPALDNLAAYGIKAAPLIAIGTPEAQALDVRTALEASLATPGRPRAVVAVAAAAAIQLLLGWALEGATTAAVQQQQQQEEGPQRQGGQQQGPAGPGVGARFRLDEGSVTVINFLPEGSTSLNQGTVLCSNFALGRPQAS